MAPVRNKIQAKVPGLWNRGGAGSFYILSIPTTTMTNRNEKQLLAEETETGI